MIRPVFILLVACSALAQAAQAPQPEPTVSASPAVNWVLPLFTDKEGYRSMTLRGSEVRPGGSGIIAVSDLNITIFSGDAAARVDSVLLSAQASFRLKEKHAAGDGAVRLIRDDLEVTGQGWTYDHEGKKVFIARNVRVTFKAQLNDILK